MRTHEFTQRAELLKLAESVKVEYAREIKARKFWHVSTHCSKRIDTDGDVPSH